jgi:6-phosphofructokinase 1
MRLSEIDLGKFIKDDVKKRLESRNIKVSIVDKDIGYELRCAAPIPFDRDYTRNLGYGVIKFLVEGGTGALINLQSGRMMPVYFSDIIDTVTGRTKVRYVDVNTEGYEVARAYMIRLEKDDFTNPEQLNHLAEAAKLTPDEFKTKFGDAYV